MQMGLALPCVDATTKAFVPWVLATDENFPALLQDITQAIKVVDLETTGLNDTSEPQNVSNKEIRRGVNPELRSRVVSITYISKKDNRVRTVGFDFDQLTADERRQVAAAALTGVFIGHNAGFDLYWLRLHAKVMPKLVIDTMLVSRVLYPEQPLVLANMCTDENEVPEFAEEARQTFIKGQSGWSLAHLALTLLRKILPKDLQGPKNWCLPFLTQKHYDYATDDTKTTFEILCRLLNCNASNLLERYKVARNQYPALKMLEPQVPDLVYMREKGTPWSKEQADKYVELQWEKVAKYAAEMCQIEPALEPFRADLANAEQGTSAKLKDAIGEAFRRRGLTLSTTEKSGQPMIGEKDLRKAKAATTETARPLFDAWVSLSRAKKAGSMAQEFTGFAQRSKDGRLHPNTGHGPATGRLSSSEPNCQQMPRDQAFRDAVAAPLGKLILASDYSALDMRVAAALAIRAQRQIFEVYLGASDRKVDDDVLAEIKRVYDGEITLDQADAELKAAKQAFAKKTQAFKENKVPREGTEKKAFWEDYRKKQRKYLLARFTRALKFVRTKADAAGTAEWGMLRDAFSIPGMDIHTWTALGMIGQDPLALFAGKSNEDVVVELKKAKKRLGDKRQTGKVGNLSLTYAMSTNGLQDAASKIYNIHWSWDEANKVREDWLATYVEVELWHTWTELNPYSRVMVPDPDRGGELRSKMVYASRTLAERLVYAFGLNAALAYEDQSSGADILGTCMDVFHRDHPEVFDCIVNQVHDEIVFEVPEALAEEYTRIVTKVMTDSAEKFLMPYGVKGECSPALGKVWLKD